MPAVDREQLLSAVNTVAQALGDVPALRAARDAEAASKHARLELLIEDRKVERLDSGCLRYHLDRPIRMGGSLAVEYLTFRRATIGDVRALSGRTGEEWAAGAIQRLCSEIGSASILDEIDAGEWDTLCEVVEHPFLPAVSRGVGTSGLT